MELRDFITEEAQPGDVVVHKSRIDKLMVITDVKENLYESIMVRWVEKYGRVYTSRFQTCELMLVVEESPETDPFNDIPY